MDPLIAYIDESGQRATSAASSDCFVMSAVIFRESKAQAAKDLLEQLRSALGRQSGHALHFRKLNHSQRVIASGIFVKAHWITVSTVVTCKRLLAQKLPDHDTAYLYTLRLLLERLSWVASARNATLRYTLAHVVHFQIAKLREYEEKLRGIGEPECKINWNSIPSPGKIDQPEREEFLQLADLTASATGAAFNKDPFGVVENRYLRTIAPRLYRGKTNKLTSYGLKMHPWDDRAKTQYPWVLDL